MVIGGFESRPLKSGLDKFISGDRVLINFRSKYYFCAMEPIAHAVVCLCGAVMW